MWTVTLFFFFFFNDTATTEIYTLSLHRRSSDLVKALEHVLEVSKKLGFKTVNVDNYVGYAEFGTGEEYITALGHVDRSEEHTSELQSRQYLVCRLLLEKKKT